MSTKVSVLLSTSCDPLFSLLDRVNESFILTRVLGIYSSSIFLLLAILPSLTLPVLPSSSESSVVLGATLAAQVPGGFLLSPGEELLGLAEVSVGLEGL